MLTLPRTPVLACLAFVLLFPGSHFSAEAVPRILLQARDPHGTALQGFRFVFEGAKTRSTNKDGQTELELPPEHVSGQQVNLQLLRAPKLKKRDEWFLVNPAINLALATGTTEVVLMRRSVIRTIAQELSKAPAASSQDLELDNAERKRQALIALAAEYGLTPTTFETAIRSFGRTTDLQDRGIAAYLAGNWARAETFLEDAVVRQEPGLRAGIDRFVEALRFLGASQYEQVKFREAIATFRKAEALKSDDTTILRWLASCLNQTAEFTEAENLMRRALEVDESVSGSTHPNVARDLNGLAALLRQQGRFAEAEPLFRRALEIDREISGARNPAVAKDLGNLALLLQHTNRLPEAESLMREAVDIENEVSGPEHPNVATALYNLAQLLQITSQLTESEHLLRRALNIDEEALGTKHPSVARDLNSLALLLRSTNRLNKAEQFMRRALDIDEEAFGTKHWRVARDLNNLGLMVQDDNRPAEAEVLLRRALSIDQEGFGPRHPNYARDLLNLAALLQKTDRLAEAEDLTRRALDILEEAFGPEHPRVAEALNNLASLLQATNRLAEAELFWRRALDIDENTFGPNHPSVAMRLNNLASLLQVTNRLTEAETLMRRSLTILLASSRKQRHYHPSLDQVTSNYAATLHAQGKTEAEIQTALEAVENEVLLED